MKEILFIPLLCCLTTGGIIAQPTQILDVFGCDDIPLSSTEAEICSYCPDFVWQGSTVGYVAGPNAGWCGTIENDQYLGFSVDNGGEILFEVVAFACSNNEGIQVGIYDQYNQPVGVCINKIDPNTSAQFNFVGLVAGEIYYLRVDGFAGDVCDFTISPLMGFEPVVPPVTVVNTPSQTQITTTYSDCFNGNVNPGDSLPGCIYSYAYDITPPWAGTVVEQTFYRQVVETYSWASPTPLRATVDKVYSLVAQDSGAVCAPTARQKHFSHFLDLNTSFNAYNTFASPNYWFCNQNRLVAELPQLDGAATPLRLFEAGVKHFTIEGAGYHARAHSTSPSTSQPAPGDYFIYNLKQNQTTIASGIMSVNNPIDTLTLDFANGPIHLYMHNQLDYPVEFALTRLAPLNSTDTIVLPSLVLADADSVLLFKDVVGVDSLLVTEPGVYYALFGCVTFQQAAINLPGPDTISLGTILLCIGECAYTPVGEEISCDPGNFTFASQMNTVYTGSIKIDSVEQLRLLSSSIACDSLSGDYFITYSWEGSRPPYTLGTLAFDTSTATVGPFQSGQAVRFLLQGASSCTEALLLEGFGSCGTLIAPTAFAPDLEIHQVRQIVIALRGAPIGAEVYLSNLQGQVLERRRVQETQQEFRLDNWPSGYYIATVVDATGTRSIAWLHSR